MIQNIIICDIIIKMVDMFTSREAYKFKTAAMSYLKTIISITIALLVYSAIKDIIYRYASDYQFTFKCIFAFILLFVITQF